MRYYGYDFLLDNLPSTLKKLQIPFGYKYPLNFLPDGLETLHLPYNYSLSLKNLPSSINEIKIIYDWTDDYYFVTDLIGIDKILPNLKVIRLKVVNNINHNLETVRKQLKLDDKVKLERY